MSTSIWFTLGFLGMLAGTVALLWGRPRIPDRFRRDYGLLVAVTGIALVAYGLMALGFGEIPIGDRSVFGLRYLDWLLTTPLNVLFLGLLAKFSRARLRRLVLAQLATIVFGFAGAVLTGPIGYLPFLVGCVAFGVVVYDLFDGVADGCDVLSETGLGLYKTLRNFIVVLWLVYPAIWLLAPPGVGLMDVETTTLVVAYLDVITKVGFGLIALNGLTTDVSIGTEPSDPESAGAHTGPTGSDVPSGARSADGGADD